MTHPADPPTGGNSGTALVGKPPPLRVFISSGMGALAPYRHAAMEVCHRLGLSPMLMDDTAGQQATPEEASRQAVESCDVFVLLLGHRYGARPPGQRLSYTEMEYRWAVERPRIAVLPFVADPAFPWPPSDIDFGEDANYLAAFVQQIRSRHTVRGLAEPSVFREDLLIALSRFSAPQPGERTEGVEEIQRQTAGPPAPPVLRAPVPYVSATRFLGRADDLAVLDDWGRSPDPVMVIEAIGEAGKSALAWHWTRERALEAVPGLAGRLWWSFYDSPEPMIRVLRELVAYTSGRPDQQIARLDQAELIDQALTALHSRPYLVVLDGFERLLAVYRRVDPAALDDELAESDPRSLADPLAMAILARLTAAAPSKILISTRLMPNTLEDRFGRELPGVRRLRLAGLTDADTRALLTQVGVQGSGQAIASFFAPLGNHPLLVAVVAGLVGDYRPDPGGFDRWLADPAAGGSLDVPSFDLTQRRNHILTAALTDLPPRSRKLLDWMAALPGAISWDTMTAINPFQPTPPSPVEPYLAQLGSPPPYPEATEAQVWDWEAAADRLRRLAERETQERLAVWQESEPVKRAEAELDAAAKDLEDRGLVHWDRSSATYALHPIIRAYVNNQLEEANRAQSHHWVRDYFLHPTAEEQSQVTSIDELAPRIAVFEALVKVGRFGEASDTWAEFDDALVVSLGAYARISTLLAPLAFRGSLRVRGDLGLAYYFLGQYEEAISHNTVLLADSIGRGNAGETCICLARLTTSLRAAGSFAAANRCTELRAAINAITNEATDGSLCLTQAVQAVIQGQVKQALTFLDRAQSLGAPQDAPWFAEDLSYWRVYLAHVAGHFITRTEIADAVTRRHSWSFRRDLAELKADFLTRDGHLREALAAAREAEKLSYDAGLVVVPARTALLLARLGRTSEAAAAAEDALSLLPRLHTAQRPHYLLALAFQELGDSTQTAVQTIAAYRQAWADGPPNSHHWKLRDANNLLAALGTPVPVMQALRPDQARAPLEATIRAFIATLKAESQAEAS